MFVRIPWVVGQAGLVGAACIILVSTAITVITVISMSAVVTNGRLPPGGVYVIVSRSLGAEVFKYFFVFCFFLTF